MSNTRALKTNNGILSLKATAAIGRNLIACVGADADHSKAAAAVTDRPLGQLIDGADAAEDFNSIAAFARGDTKVLKSSGAASRGDYACPAVDGSGEVRKVPTAAGFYWCIGRYAEDAVDHQEVAIDDCTPYLVAGPPADIIVVGKNGSDTAGDGSFALPYATLTKAMTVATAARSTIIMLPGAYEEAATITWPNVTGLKIVGIGEVSISNGNAAAQVILINPTYTAATFEASLTNVNIAADTQIGIKIDNANMTKKLNVYLKDVSTEMDTSGDSVTVSGTTSSQAVRVYVNGCSFEGLFTFTASNAASRFRCANSQFTGGITTAGAVAAELSLRACEVLTSGLTIGSATWNLTYRGSVYATDADPAVYSELADGYSA